TPHAAAHDIGGIDSQIIQQGLCLPRVTTPPQALHPATRSARFAPIIENDRMLCCKCIERVNGLSRRWLQSICQSWHQSRPAQTSATANPNLSFHNKLQSHQEWQLPSFFLLRSILKSSRLLLKQFTAAILDISASDTVRSSTPPIQKKA